MTIETVKVPDLGGADDVEVIEISVGAGDRVSEEDTLLVLESDKASMDVPSPMAGTVKKVLVKLGDSVSQGTAIVELEVEDTAGEDSAADEDEPEKSEAEAKSKEEAAPEDKEEKTPDSGSADQAAAASPAGGKKKGGAEGGEGGSSPQSSEQPLNLPDLGTDEAVDVIEVAVAAGDQVEEGDALMTLEGDKATMDVPSPRAGKITALSVKEGDKVKSGQEIGTIEAVAEAADDADSAQDAESTPREETPREETPREETPRKETPQKPDGETAKKEKTPDESSPQAASEAPSPGGDGEKAPLEEPEAPAAEVYAGPVVRQFARELGIDLRNVEGSGARGRIQKQDLKDYVKSVVKDSGKGAAGPAGGGIPGIPDQDFSRYGEVEEVDLNKVARLTAANMHRAWLNAPMVTQFDDADITELEAFRKGLKAEAEQRGVRITPLAFLMKACAAVLEHNPVLNRSWHSSGEKVIQKHYLHIGMAVDTPKGLMVPVVRDVDQKGIFDLAADIATLAEKARNGKLSGADMQGGCFTISSLGAIGGRGFTPIVNAPEAAILGVSKAAIQPVWNGESFEPRQMLPLSLTYDHKLVNGADAGRFLTDLVATIGDMRRILL